MRNSTKIMLRAQGYKETKEALINLLLDENRLPTVSMIRSENIEHYMTWTALELEVRAGLIQQF